MLLHKELSDQILAAFYEVYHELGHGFLERVYQNALYHELKIRGIEVEAQRQCTVYYKGKAVGDYFSDILVNDVIILELKACETIAEEHEIQLVNYLKATSVELGFVLNFGPEPEFCRRVFSNQNKKHRGG